VDEELHSLSRRLIELRMEHADLDGRIDHFDAAASGDDLQLRRLKKRRLRLRDEIDRLVMVSAPDEPA